MSHDPAPSRTLVNVDLGQRSYPIHIGEGVLAEAGALIAPHLKRPFTVIVTDDNVAPLHLDRLGKALEAAGIQHRAVIVPAGEASKSFARLESLCRDLLAAGVERADTILAFGGGVIGDLAGFAAAILRRGVDFIQLPTTVLAQVDSSVGGKTGINTPEGKNLIGAFHQPKAVLADTGVLETLPPRQFRAGYAEIVKYGLIDNPEFFEWCEQNWRRVYEGDTGALIHAVGVSCRAKAAIVARDERESGCRALLNLGHTFGHVLEAATSYSDRLYHGEGVAAGMALAFRYSVAAGLCSGQDAGRVCNHLAAAGLPVELADIEGELPDTDSLMQLMEQDKKIAGGKLVLILARGIGRAFIAADVPRGEVRDFLSEIREPR
ncbi:MAG: 3-dehydroquinate synthase [Hyphomicrobiales bacterium]|nr:MAG: 3-dehydroquinate synthase [Hyphomicrobiales bacterium]